MKAGARLAYTERRSAMSFVTGRTPQYKVHQRDGSVRVFRNAASAARYVAHLTQTGLGDQVSGYEASGETKELRQRRTEAIRNEIERLRPLPGIS
jgi:hypothetical protein